MHLRTKYRIDSGKLRKRKHRRLDEETADAKVLRQGKIRQSLSGHYQRGDTRDWNTGRLRNKRNGSRRTRIYLEHENAMVFNRKLDVHQTAHAQSGSQQTRVVAHSLDVFRINP